MPRPRAQVTRTDKSHEFEPLGLDSPTDAARRLPRKAAREEKCVTLELERHLLCEAYQVQKADYHVTVEGNETADAIAAIILG